MVAGIGVALVALDERTVGLTLCLTGTGSMLAAALVLLLTSPDKRRAALSQGTLPLLAVVSLVPTVL